MKKLLYFIAFVFIFTGCSEKVPVEITADYLAEEYIQLVGEDFPVMELQPLTEEYDLFISDNDMYSAYVVFSANTKVKNFRLYVIAVPAGDEIIYQKEKPRLCYDDLSEDKSLVIRMDMPETLPWYGISYTDENGDTVNYAIHLSGKDGSVILEKFD